MTMNSRERVLKLFAGEEVDRPPCFSGMGNVTTEGLKALGQNFAATHLDAKMMAAAAASTYKLFGFECGVAPFDLCIEAEAMGCEINVYAHSEDLLYPTIKKKLIHNEAELDIAIPSGLTERGSSVAGRMSNGEQRQLEIAMLIASGADLLVLDEPLAGMGPEETQRVVSLLRDLVRDHTIILIEHDMDAVFAVADTLTVLAQGKLLAQGSPDEIRADRAVLEAYLGRQAEVGAVA